MYTDLEYEKINIYKERTIINILKNAVNQWADEKFLFKKTDEGWNGDTYSDVDNISDYLAIGFLNTLCLNKDDKVAIISEGRPEWVETELGIMKAHLIAVPLSIKLSIDEIKFRLEHSETKCVVFSSNTAVKVYEVLKTLSKDIKVVFLDEYSNFIETKSSEIGFVKNKNFFYLTDLLKDGKNFLSKNPKYVNNIVSQIKEDDVCVISYTSGTTGNPKGVMLMHKSYYNNSMLVRDLFQGIKPFQLTSVLILPVDHAFAHTVSLYHALSTGDKIYFTDARKGNASMIANFPKNLKEVNPYYLLLVPAILSSFRKKINATINKQPPIIKQIFKNGISSYEKLKGDGYNKPNLSLKEKAKHEFNYNLAKNLVFKKIKKELGSPKFIVVGGAALDQDLSIFFNAIGIEILTGYGMTETGPVISANSSYRKNWIKFNTVGKIPNFVECKIIDENEKECAINVKGEICVKGDSNMKGYFKNEDATKEAFTNDGYIKTGDIGYFDEDGFLHISGRSKALLVSREGEKTSPEEIENEILSSSIYINQMILVNNENPYTIALITVDKEVFTEHFKNKNYSADEIYNRMLKDCKKYENKSSVNPMWRPAEFIITGFEWIERDGLINSTMKVVRPKVIKKFNDLVNTAFNNREQIKDHNINEISKFLKEI